ncbi:hypothetical protein RKD40_005056 [Streptomyces ambofaciens]
MRAIRPSRTVALSITARRVRPENFRNPVWPATTASSTRCDWVPSEVGSANAASLKPSCITVPKRRSVPVGPVATSTVDQVRFSGCAFSSTPSWKISATSATGTSTEKVCPAPVRSTVTGYSRVSAPFWFLTRRTTFSSAARGSRISPVTLIRSPSRVRPVIRARTFSIRSFSAPRSTAGSIRKSGLSQWYGGKLQAAPPLEWTAWRRTRPEAKMPRPTCHTASCHSPPLRSRAGSMVTSQPAHS